MRDIIDPGWPEFRGRTYVPAVRSRGSLVFTSGLNALGADGTVQYPGDVVGQARTIYAKLRDLLHTLDARPDSVVKTTDFILSRHDYAATATVRREFFGDALPASTGVVVEGLLGKGVLIEIEAVLVLPDESGATT